MIEYGHYHEEGAAEVAYLGTDDDVVFMHAFQKFAKTAFVYRLSTADCFTYPFIDLQVVFLAEPFYLEALVLDRLPVGADANVSVYHFSVKVQQAIIPGKYDADIKSGEQCLFVSVSAI